MTDDLMALADAVFETPARQSDRPDGGHPLSGGPVQDVPAVRARDEGRVGGAVGAATFSLPPVPGVPRFGGDDKPQPGQPNPPTGPSYPYPPPRIGEGPLYDALPVRHRGGRPYGHQPLNPASPYRRP